MIINDILSAKSYLDLFPNVGIITEETIKKQYRKLVKIAHPDAGGTPEAFSIVKAYYNESLRRIETKTFGQTRYESAENTTKDTNSIITSKNNVYELLHEFSATDLAVTYIAKSKSKNVLLKVVKSPSDNDLFMREQEALTKLHSYAAIKNNNENWNDYTPTLIESFSVKNTKNLKQYVNVFELTGDWYTLPNILLDNPYGLDPLDAVWMFRRVLMVLGFAHDNKIVHGAITPTNISIYPQEHGLILMNWENSSIYSELIGYDKTPTADSNYMEYYPPNVLLGQPAEIQNDLYMAMQLGKTLFKNYKTNVCITQYFNRYCEFKATTTLTAWDLLSEFDDVLKMIGEPYYPKRWKPFNYPK